jgi:hypothetical protein
MFRHLGEKKEGQSAGDRPLHRITGVRREVKYLLGPKEGALIKERVSKNIPAKSVKGTTSSFRVSVYLDTPQYKFAKAELASGRSSIKLRAKDYYVIDGDVPIFEELCWLEVKARMGTMVEKNRFAVKRTDVARILKTGPDPSADPAERASQEAFESMRAGQPLCPLVVAHYHRHTFQDPEANLRITFDDLVTFHVPPPNLYADGKVCSRSSLAPPLLAEPKWIVEVKSLGAAPAWVDDIFDIDLQSDYSKFGTGVRRLSGLGLIDIST